MGKHQHQKHAHSQGHNSHARPNTQHFRQPTSAPHQPTNGLASPMNRQYVMQIFQVSTSTEVDDVLRATGFASRTGLVRPSHDDAVNRQAQQFIQSDAGRKQVALRVKQLVKEQADHELASPRTQSMVDEIKANFLAERIADDPASFAQLCQQKVADLVERWIQSQHGQDTVEAERSLAVRRLVARTPTTKWTQRPSLDSEGKLHGQ